MAKPPPNASPPLIPETFLDVPTQRLYVLSLALLFQAIKVFDFLRSLSGTVETSFTRRWMIIDAALCAGLAKLRIPRLRYSKAAILLHIALLWFLDGLMFGGLRLQTSEATRIIQRASERPDLPATPEPFRIRDLLSSVTLGLITSYDGSDAHLLGQHTVRLSPISTAQLNPQRDTFCLSPSQPAVLIPVLLNNTDPIALRYTMSPLGTDVRSKVQIIDLSSKDIKAIEALRLAGLPSSRSPGRKDDEYDEYDEEEGDGPTSTLRLGSRALQKTESLIHLRVNKPGTVKLERLIDASHVEARLAYSSDVTVAPCPQAQFLEPRAADELIRCSGDDSDVNLLIDINGVPPLSLKWQKVINERRHQFVVEGIEGDEPHITPDAKPTESPSTALVRRGRAAQSIKVPLTVPLDAVGLHRYELQEVIDGVGNIVRLPSVVPPSKLTRAVRLLRRPAVSFKQCGPGQPKSLLIGSETPLTISTNDADALDGPWDITYKYQPSEDAAKAKYKPYKKTVKTEGSKRDLILQANVPGEYSLLGVTGQHCQGDILAPDSCPVIEKPHPSAEVDWRKIHECSGDTGVSASLVLHGTPPFIVYYRMQRDKNAPRDLSKTFTSSRGELHIQPQDDGHFVFSINQISDANYQRIDLKAPSIDQIIHPLASAEFVRAGQGRRKISSCGGSVVDVDVDLKGTGPWTIEVQIVDSKGTQTLEFKNIETSRKKVQIPIPTYVDQHGGTFDIALASVTDKAGCKRALTVPSITVNVRRILPTAKFYGSEDKRRATILEHDDARLPLRLTGDGPWEIKYRHHRSGLVRTSKAVTPNDFLIVRDPGQYELLEVIDSECPGSIVADSSTYAVDWIPKPSVRLSNQTDATYVSYNNSYTLPGICEGLPGHVDLELTGRSPFQIMYNIAQNNGIGGTRIIDQPIFNSIQHRTRFELQTQSAGLFFYEVKQVGDVAYPLEKHKTTIIPRSERLLFEQQVYVRPAARFESSERLTFCLHDTLTSPDSSSFAGSIRLEGTPPFTLQLSVKNIGASKSESIEVEVNTHNWKLNLPSYQFESVGAHLVTIESVKDASSCAHATLDPLFSSIWVDVAETALIVPVDRREDFCVGEVSSFQMEGIPPWTIGYRINGKAHKQEARTSPFSLIQQHPGDFTITSISHQQSRCQAAVTDLRFKVHPIPSAKVGHGKRIFEDIHEGDQAEILFTLEGEPPFTFTYQRAEPQKKKGKPGKVLETHTVSRIMSHEYSIFSAQEGTWTVTSIQDKFCRYPPVQPDS